MNKGTTFHDEDGRSYPARAVYEKGRIVRYEEIKPDPPKPPPKPKRAKREE